METCSLVNPIQLSSVWPINFSIWVRPAYMFVYPFVLLLQHLALAMS